ncbi:MAG: efflux RND transporter periplasmic adaptor subunit [Flavitalea sp.]
MRNYLYIILLFLAACKDKVAEPVAETSEAPVQDVLVLSNEQISSVGIKTGIVSKQSMKQLLKVNGVVDVPPQNMISISFPLGGFLRSTTLLPGTKVSKGQVIAIMEDQSLVQLQQDYLIAKSKLLYAQQDYDRQTELNKSKANSDKVLQLARNEFEVQSVMVRSLSEKLKMIGISPNGLKESSISRRVNIYSPVNGFVSKVNVNVGRFVQPTEVLFELIDPADLHVALTVFEKDIDRIRAGQKVAVSFVDDTSKNYQAEVFLVTRNVDENRAGNVHCHFIRMPSTLRPGMFVNAEIWLSENNVIAVPEAAVVHYGNQDFVFIKEASQKFRLMPIVTGLKTEGMIEIQSGTAIEGKEIITENAYSALMKLKNVSEEE